MNLLIIQARMGSSRLPGKVLKTIKGKTLLELQYLRVRSARLVDLIVVATTTNKEDDAIEQLCAEKGIRWARGSEQDVLDRYYQTAKQFGANNVIRITSDCPLHHHTVVDFGISKYLELGRDYFSNSNNEPTFLEDGFDVEVFSFRALETAWQNAQLKSDREHVTPYIKYSGRFNCEWQKYNENYKYKLSVDNLDDFRAVEAVFESFQDLIGFGMEDVIELIETRPEILEINKSSAINTGYQKSLKDDKAE